VSINGHVKADVAAPARASTPLEIALGALWAGALRRDRVGLDDNFFMLGGDSLRGARLLTEVNAAFGCDLQVPALFDDANTVAGMARAIERARQ
jgi:acyl carrier protein